MPSITYWPEMTFPATGEGYSSANGPCPSPWYSYTPISVPYMSSLDHSAPTASNGPSYQDISYEQSITNQSSFVEERPSEDKPPLTQLQELTNVFSTPNACTLNSKIENHLCGEAENQGVEPKDEKQLDIQQKTSPVEHNGDTVNAIAIPNKTQDSDNSLVNHDSDSGYITDLSAKESCETNFQRVEGDEVQSVASQENQTHQICSEIQENGDYMDSYPMEHSGQLYNGFEDMDDFRHQQMFDSNYNVIEEPPPDDGKILPGFQQAFGSTEIGRFSINDFFPNPPPPPMPICQPMDNDIMSMDYDIGSARRTRSKAPRKPRANRRKNVQNGLLNGADESFRKTYYDSHMDDTMHSCNDKLCESNGRQVGCVKYKNKKQSSRGEKKSDSYRLNSYESSLSKPPSPLSAYGSLSHPSTPLSSYGNSMTQSPNLLPTFPPPPSSMLPTYRDDIIPPMPGLPSFPNSSSSNLRFNWGGPYPYNYRNQALDGIYSNRCFRDSFLSRTNDYDTSSVRGDCYSNRYQCPDGYGPEQGYPYMRNNFSNYPNYDPYMRPFGFNVDYSQWPHSQSSDWSNRPPSWSSWSGQSWLGHPNWTSQSMFPHMRLDY